MGWPPLETSKKFVPKCRSKITSTSAMAMEGMARMSRKLVISAIQVNTGTRIIVMPGARRLMIVVMKFSEATMDDTPSTCRPTVQRSAEMSGVKVFEVSGA